MLTRDEFLNLFFDDLELPDLVKQQIVNTDSMVSARAGFSVDGTPARLDMARTMRQSMARRIGLRRPKSEELEALEADITRLEGDDPALQRRGGRLWRSPGPGCAASPGLTRWICAIAATPRSRARPRGR